MSSSPLGATATEPPPHEARRARVALLTIVSCQLMLVLDITIVNVALPHIQQTLYFSTTNLAWVINAYTLAYGGLLLLGGRTGDILGRRNTLVGGIVLFTVASLLGGLSTEPWMLVAARVGQGVGAACASPNALALIAANFPEGPARTKAMGAWAAVSGVGGSIGLIVGGMLTTWLSWRWVMFINVPFGAAIVLLAPRVLRTPPRQQGRFDAAGALASVIGLASLVYGFLRASSDGWSDSQAQVAFGLAVVALAAFGVIESRAAQPVVPRQLVTEPHRVRSYLLMLLLTGSMLSMFFFGTQVLQEILRFSALRAGLAFLPLSLGILVSASRASKLLPRFGPKPLMLVGAALGTGGMSWLSQVSTDSSYVSIMLGPLLMFGFGLGLLFVPLSVSLVAGVPPKLSGAAASMMVTVQQVGGALGVAVLVTVFGTASRHSRADVPAGSSTADAARYVLAHGVARAFLVGAFLVAAIFLIVLATRPLRVGDAMPPAADLPAGRKVPGQPPAADGTTPAHREAAAHDGAAAAGSGHPDDAGASPGG
ncbi:drug resistance transporter, EmrB/QacA subfamily [Parafrankia irregularis]|uniref:Drug resistance transporter, EmrB/QacA subfamily n=1 Tax=Parafrankia irregularis TaxID=795642 RepID=A0A0S4QPC3_9ACTN|nr:MULTISPECIES: MFS transporter [Parafrankia]MBE3201229.1 MFS transporter [Parafrankia sp. CH37]CUU56330.1 drug resistance transporter, EmrB/QacA subfamily [Parafrankia irregularis]